jgi:predicted NBD/HSP70 family sugar kinase
VPGKRSNPLRHRHRLELIASLRQDGPASRAELVRRTGLSRVTISGLVADLLDRGIVVEREDPDGPSGRGAGRRPSVLTLGPAAGTVLGVDFGHTHLRVVAADLSGQVLAEGHRAVDVDRSAAEALDEATALIDALLKDARIDADDVIGVGMGLPGPIDSRTGVVGSSVILPGWAGLHPADELQRRLGFPVEVDNDANLGALAEVLFGAARGARDAVYVKVSSGVGAGLFVGGRIHHGASGITGELGHTLVDPNGTMCRCGNRGCLETRAAAPALLDILRPTYGDDLTADDIVRLANDGDVGCSRVLGDAGQLIGRALAEVCNLLNPELIVVGGELSGAGAPLLKGIRDAVDRYALPAVASAVDLRAGLLGSRAEVLGAVALIIRDSRQVSPALRAA